MYVQLKYTLTWRTCLDQNWNIVLNEAIHNTFGLPLKAHPVRAVRVHSVWNLTDNLRSIYAGLLLLN